MEKDGKEGDCELVGIWRNIDDEHSLNPFLE